MINSVIYQVKRLILIGGIDVKKSVKNSMDYLLTNEMHGLFNWSGKAGLTPGGGITKMAFKTTYLLSVIISEYHNYSRL